MTIAQILQKTTLFKILSDDQLKAVLQFGEEKRFEPGEEIFKQGDLANTHYVLLDGLVRLSMIPPEEPDLMAETLREPGSVFGIAALSKYHVYNVTAKCIEKTKVFAMDSARLKEIIARYCSS